MSNVEDYQNLVIVLKQALEFYANKDNYEVNVPQNNVLFAYIEMDKGAQARFAFEKIQELENNQKNLEQQFVADITKAIENNEETDNVLNLIEEYRKTTEND
jgi:hypothetical protein